MVIRRAFRFPLRALRRIRRTLIADPPPFKRAREDAPGGVLTRRRYKSNYKLSKSARRRMWRKKTNWTTVWDGSVVDASTKLGGPFPSGYSGTHINLSAISQDGDESPWHSRTRTFLNMSYVKLRGCFSWGTDASAIGVGSHVRVIVALVSKGYNWSTVNANTDIYDKTTYGSSIFHVYKDMNIWYDPNRSLQKWIHPIKIKVPLHGYTQKYSGPADTDAVNREIHIAITARILDGGVAATTSNLIGISSTGFLGKLTLKYID